MRLTFPSFESRAEIAHMVGDRDVRERWPRDPDGVPLYPGAARQLKEPDRQARISRGDPYAIRLDIEKATEWTGPLRWSETGAGPSGESGDIAADPAAFVASLDDPEARGGPITLPDGSTVKRLPGYRRWMWDDGFCGSMNFRWQPGTSDLPEYVLGHLGYAVVP